MEDRLVEIWLEQQKQQAELGLDPKHMNPVERRTFTSELVLQLYEEAGEIARLVSTYKRHLLASPPVDKDNVAEEVADVLKTILVIAQLHGLTVYDVVEAFHRKTRVVKSKAEGSRTELEHRTRLVCVDLDDVISDLSQWIRTVKEAQGGIPGKHNWNLQEALKDEFYRDGKFRDMPPVDGAPEGMRELKSRGYTLVIVTARPQWQYKRLYADTLEWLDNHSIPCDHILFNKDKVEAVHQHLAPAWPVAFIEDHERNARSLADAGIPVLLFDKPSNRDFEGENVRRVCGWNGILEVLK